MENEKKGPGKSKVIMSNAVIVLMLMVHAFIMSIISLLMGMAIDSAEKGLIDKFFMFILISLILVVVRFLAQTLAYRLIFRICCDKLLEVKDKLFRKDLIKDGWKNVDYSTNLEIIYANRYFTIYTSIDNVITLFFAIFTLFSIDWRAVIIGVLGALIPILSPILTQGKIRKNSLDYAAKSQIFQRFSFDHLNIKDEINRYNVEDEVYDKYRKHSAVQENARFKFENILYFATILSSGLGTLSILIVLLFAGILVSRGILTVGMIVSVMQLTSSLVAPIVQLSNIKSTYESSRPIFDSFKFDEEYEFKDPVKLEDGDLELKDIHFSYPDGEELFDGFSKKFEKGKKYLIQGQSGRGKSTLASIIAGELKPSEGAIYFNGQDIYNKDIKSSNIGYQNQVNKIFTGSLFDNIDFYRSYDPQDVKNMHDNVNLKPALDKIVEPNFGLSGGEKTLVALSRALLEVRDVMIFDEPTTGLNDELSEAITEKILSLPSTVIVISHISDINFSNKFDEVITL